MSMANQTYILDPWPSEAIKKKAGRSAWGRWRPKAGQAGSIVKRWPDVLGGVWLLKIDDYYVPIKRQSCAAVRLGDTLKPR